MPDPQTPEFEPLPYSGEVVPELGYFHRLFTGKNIKTDQVISAAKAIRFVVHRDTLTLLEYLLERNSREPITTLTASFEIGLYEAASESLAFVANDLLHQDKG